MTQAPQVELEEPEYEPAPPAPGSTLLPTSTYRLQFTADFGFREALAIVPYLDRLGITHIYASPLLKARSASTHGYDVVDPARLDPKFGTHADFVALGRALRRRGMGLVLDIVPNHMAASIENPWLLDVLARGRGSAFGEFFDIDWDANDGRMLLPILQGSLDRNIRKGTVRLEGDEIAVGDDGLRFPTALGTVRGTLEQVLSRQHYELADWHEQATRLNYRRFFDVADLVCLRAEREDVFEASHALILELIADGLVQGLRVDHVDGLADPRAYLERLQHAASWAAGVPEGSFWIVVEKILGVDETLPPDWAVAGATGYELLDATDAVLTDAYGARRLQRVFGELTGATERFDALTFALKLRTGRTLFRGELGSLARMVARVWPDSELPDVAELGDAILALTAGLDVYRTYIDASGASAEDRVRIGDAARRAVEAGAESPLLVARVAELIPDHTRLAVRWQQFSGPLMAKSVEDTAFYRFVAVPSRDEVGADPGGQPSLPVATFHELMAARLACAPSSLSASTTHDTKRSEDVRARLSVLTRRHEEWQQLVEARFAADPPPDRVDAYLALTTLVGAWPIEPGRLAQYLTKAMREGKRSTSWLDVDAAYEQSVIDWADRQRDAADVAAFAVSLATPGDRTELTALALKLVVPGVPDIYQGTELRTLTLVDPDNRRAVDFAEREQLLDAVEAGGSADVPDKLRLLHAGLRLRREQPELFARGAYHPLSIQGAHASRAIGCARELDGAWVMLVAPRLDDDVRWGDELVLPPVSADWRNVVTGEPVTDLTVRALLADFPVALLVSC